MEESAEEYYCNVLIDVLSSKVTQSFWAVANDSHHHAGNICSNASLLVFTEILQVTSYFLPCKGIPLSAHDMNKLYEYHKSPTQ